ncbi:uncharacterized protein [Paramisgurnus dabryanus]|uniref:uncharacterized protein n=1 Tax=Paramisgurnus dabryanus TaxID=90735 RepID=UPI0031F42BD3
MNILSIVFVLTVALNICLGFILQMSKVQVFPQDSVVLPCKSSGFPKEELYWKVMGKDVVSLHGGNITVTQGFEDRVFLMDPDLSEDFSLILKDVMFNDGGVYKCLWMRQITICSVHVHVLKPLVFPVFATVGEEVTLKCFGHISKNQAWEDLNIQWFKDHREVLRLTSGKIDVNVENSSMSLPCREDLSRGIFSLTIRSVRDLDQGVYHCWYRTADYEEPRSGLPESHTLTVLAVSSEVSSTTDSILSVSDGSHTHTSRSVSTLRAVASTTSESSRPVSTQTNVKRSETEPITTASVQTYAETAEAVSSEVSSTTDSILSVSDGSHTHTSRSGSTLRAVANTLSESSRPVSTQTYVKRSETEPITTASAQTSAEIAKAVSSEVSSTTDSILSFSDSSHTHTSRSGLTLRAVANTSSESSRPVSTQTNVKRSETEPITTASAQTYAETAEAVSSTTDSILSVSDSSHTHTSRSVSTLTAVANTLSESSRPVSTHAYVKKSETESFTTASAQTSAEIAEGRYGHLKMPLDKKIPWILIGLISGVLLITAGVLVSLFIIN